MHKKVNEIAKRRFIQRMALLAPEFKLVSIGGKDGSGHCVIEHRLDAKRKSWIVFGGEKDSDLDLHIECAWTTEGCRREALPLVWLGDRPIPPSGTFNPLIDGQLDGCEAEYSGEALRISLPQPSIDLQNRALTAYFEGEEYRTKLAKLVAWELRQKNPLPETEVDRQKRDVERNMAFLWSSVVAMLADYEAEVSAAVDVALEELFSLVIAKAIPVMQQLVKA